MSPKVATAAEGPDALTPHEGLQPGWFSGRSWVPGDRTYRPIDESDLPELMRWRNEQQVVLRQQEELTLAHQRRWFTDVVEPSYQQIRPRSLQVIALNGATRVSYGGLTNIEWVSRRAELSFLAATELAQSFERYAAELQRFLAWTAAFAFGELGFNRIFTETWDFRDKHIEILEGFGFVLEGRLRHHVAKGGRAHDALLHGLLAKDWRSA
ncbi:MAG: GNAT family protein [Actinomycetota bacterium]|nr:GNAT family protein [Actinomycetota bacterium]